MQNHAQILDCCFEGLKGLWTREFQGVAGFGTTQEILSCFPSSFPSTISIVTSFLCFVISGKSFPLFYTQVNFFPRQAGKFSLITREGTLKPSETQAPIYIGHEHANLCTNPCCLCPEWILPFTTAGFIYFAPARPVWIGPFCCTGRKKSRVLTFWRSWLMQETVVGCVDIYQGLRCGQKKEGLSHLFNTRDNRCLCRSSFMSPHSECKSTIVLGLLSDVCSHIFVPTTGTRTSLRPGYQGNSLFPEIKWASPCWNKSRRDQETDSNQEKKHQIRTKFFLFVYCLLFDCSLPRGLELSKRTQSKRANLCSLVACNARLRYMLTDWQETALNLKQMATNKAFKIPPI